MSLELLLTVGIAYMIGLCATRSGAVCVDRLSQSPCLCRRASRNCLDILTVIARGSLPGCGLQTHLFRPCAPWSVNYHETCALQRGPPPNRFLNRVKEEARVVAVSAQIDKVGSVAAGHGPGLIEVSHACRAYGTSFVGWICIPDCFADGHLPCLLMPVTLN